jgi:hypothetical protein
MWGFELYLKFAQGGGDIEKPKQKKPLSENESEDKTETENSPSNESETKMSETGINAKLKPKRKVEPKAETFEPNSEKPVSKKDAETDSKTATVLQLGTQFFPYEKHIKNARQSFRRAFDESRKPTTILNRMAMAQQHINALLFEGFNVWIDKNERSLLHFDKLNNPTLKANNWECVIELNSGIPSMEKFEFEEELAEVG